MLRWLCSGWMPRRIFGELIGGVLSLIGGERRNSAQEDAAARQMEFQAHMSNTAHQREVEDLVKAGLNPMLSSKFGGASTPQGAMPQLEDTITPAVNTGMAAAINRASIKKLEAETKEKSTQADLHTADAMLRYQEMQTQEAQRILHTASASELQNREMLQNAQTVRAQSQTESDLIQRALWRAQQHETLTRAERESLETLFRQQDWPRIVNERNAAMSWYGEHIMPYTRSVHDLGSSAGALLRYFAPWNKYIPRQFERRR